MKPRVRFASSARPRGGVVEISGAEFRHLHAVRRIGAGERVEVIDPTGAQFSGVVAEIARDRAIISIETELAAKPACQLILACALIKTSRMDFIVEKAGELGAHELWPVACERCVAGTVSPNRIARWRRLAIAAAKQSLVPNPMLVREPIMFPDLIREARRDTLGLICRQGAQALRTIEMNRDYRRIILAIGPEGDFSSDELKDAERAGFGAVSLGLNRMRAETAAIAALAIASHLLVAQG